MDPDPLEETNEPENVPEQVNFSEYHRYCYLCNENILADGYLYHLMQYHPMTMSVMYSLYFPELEAEEILPFLLNTALDSIVDHMDYGSLQELCDTIGYHKVGISDIKAVSDIKDKTCLQDEDTCPICMDFLHEKETVYVMKVCNHSYCKECIETWASENKTCPVCKKELDQAPQMASMSTDPSDSPSASSSDPAPSPC